MTGDDNNTDLRLRREEMEGMRGDELEEEEDDLSLRCPDTGLFMSNSARLRPRSAKGRVRGESIGCSPFASPVDTPEKAERRRNFTEDEDEREREEREEDEDEGDRLNQRYREDRDNYESPQRLSAHGSGSGFGSGFVSGSGSGSGFVSGSGSGTGSGVGTGRRGLFETELEPYRIVSIVCGWDHCLALDNRGKVRSWGSGQNGKLGRGSEESVSVPSLITALSGVFIVSISAGCEHSAAVTDEGVIYTWGHGDGEIYLIIYSVVYFSFHFVYLFCDGEMIPLLLCVCLCVVHR